MRALGTTDEQQARIVELRYFAGLTIEETAEVIGISPATVKRDWMVAKAFLEAGDDAALEHLAATSETQPSFG